MKGRNIVGRYVDGFVLSVPTRKLAAYKRIALKAGKVWREHGALEYRECAGDDLKVRMGVSFTKMAKARRGETVMFSWIVYKSRADRDRVNARVMEDPRIIRMISSADGIFDHKRMAYGGFSMLVDSR